MATSPCPIKQPNPIDWMNRIDELLAEYQRLVKKLKSNPNFARMAQISRELASLTHEQTDRLEWRN